MQRAVIGEAMRVGQNNVDRDLISMIATMTIEPSVMDRIRTAQQEDRSPDEWIFEKVHHDWPWTWMNSSGCMVSCMCQMCLIFVNFVVICFMRFMPLGVQLCQKDVPYVYQTYWWPGIEEGYSRFCCQMFDMSAD